MAAQNQPSARILDIDDNPVAEVEITLTAACTNFIGSPSLATRTAKSDTEGRFVWEVFYPPVDPLQCINGLEMNYRLKKLGFTFSRDQYRFVVRSSYNINYDDRLPLIYAMLNETPTWAAVSAANYRAPLTNDMIAAGFGAGLAAETASARALPLPTTLGNRRVLIKDSTGVEYAAPLIFVSPGQINFITPGVVARGAVVLRVADNNDATVSVRVDEISALAFGLFTANANGRGVAAGQILRLRPGRAPVFEPLAQFDPATGRFVALPIDFGPEDNELYLVLYGTGFRRVDSLREINALVKDLAQLEVTYAGPQPSFAGLDQLNLKLPRSLAGRGDVEIFIRVGNSSLTSNLVQIRIK